jgi:hypothetical protein
MCISAVLGVGSALIGASSANKAAKSQERAAQQQMDVAREQFETTRQDLAPFRQAGGNALSAYQFELGLGERPTFGGSPMQITTIPGGPGQASQGMVPINGDPSNGYMPGQVSQPTPARYSVGGQMFDTMEQAQAFANANQQGGQAYGGISMSPGTTFALEQGRDTIEAGAAARSGLNSGATLAGLERLRFGLSAQDRETQLNRLGGLVGVGQSSAAMSAANSANFTQNANLAYGNMGNAQAAGAIGVGNALQGGLQNLASSWGYQSSQQPLSMGETGFAPTQSAFSPAQNLLAPTSSLRPRQRPLYGGR